MVLMKYIFRKLIIAPSWLNMSNIIFYLLKELIVISFQKLINI